MIENLSRKTAVELASLIATKAVSPVEVLDAHLATIARVNPKLNAIVTLVADGALVLAQQAEAVVMRGEKLGSLHGLPVAIKDASSTAVLRLRFSVISDFRYLPAQCTKRRSIVRNRRLRP